MATKRTPQVPGDTPYDYDLTDDESMAATPPDDVATSNLPRACDIDPTKISRAVLTQDGWICPA